MSPSILAPDILVRALLVQTELTSHCSHKKQHDKGRPQQRLILFLFPCSVVSLSRIHYFLIHFVEQWALLEIPAKQHLLWLFCIFDSLNPLPHPFNTHLLWVHLCFFLSLLPLPLPFGVSLPSFGILETLFPVLTGKPITHSRHGGNTRVGPLCNDTSSKCSPSLQHFVAQRLAERKDVSFYLMEFDGFVFHLLVQRGALSELVEWCPHTK